MNKPQLGKPQLGKPQLGKPQLGKPQLTIVGTGMRPEDHMTPESRRAIERCDTLCYLVSESAESFVKSLTSGRAESCRRFYSPEKSLLETYTEMVDFVVGFPRRGDNTCFALYGHPGVFVYPSHEALRQTRAAGIVAEMLPGISAEDCLFADLGLDPAVGGCQSYWATDLLLNPRGLDNATGLIIWSVGIAGSANFTSPAACSQSLQILLQRLLQSYPPHHSVYIYEAAENATDSHRADCWPLAQLPQAGLTPESTLYVPPAAPPRADKRLYQSFGFPLSAIQQVFQARPPLLVEKRIDDS